MYDKGQKSVKYIPRQEVNIINLLLSGTSAPTAAAAPLRHQLSNRIVFPPSFPSNLGFTR
eukprot:5347685-Heterocapsa_arctica.AAC.1